jgi:aryl carrier-like protein
MTLGHEERTERFCELIRVETASLLELSPTEIEDGVPLENLGFDSMMGLQLRDTLQELSGVRVDLTKLSATITIRDLALALVDRAQQQTLAAQPDQS